MSVIVVQTPNRAADMRERSLGVRQECVAVVASGRCCPNDSRWLLVDDQGAEIRVCRLHANKAERAGSLAVIA